MNKYEEFARDYLQGQDEINLLDINVERLADALEAEAFDISNKDLGEKENWIRLNRLNEIAKSVCI